MNRRFLTIALIVICLSLTVNKSSACNNPPWAVICPEYEYYEYIPIGEDACFSLDAGDLDGEIEEWEVDFDDGSTPESGYGSPPSEVTHEYSEAGIYEPTLTVWDDWGNPGSDSCEVYVVEVDGVYEGEYGTGPVFKCPGETVHLWAEPYPWDWENWPYWPYDEPTWEIYDQPVGANAKITVDRIWKDEVDINDLTLPGNYVIEAYCGDSSADITITVVDVNIITPSSFPAYVGLGDNLQLDCTPLGATDGTYSWTKVTGPGTVTFSPSANEKDPNFSANQPGDYTVKVEYTKEGATADDTSGTITVYSVDTVIWETYPGNTSLGSCPNNGGSLIFPGKKTYDDTGAADRKKVRVKATITPVLDNKHVYFSWWDVDDPSTDDSPIDTNGSTGNDNRGSGESLSTTSAVTNGSGNARVTFTVSMNPGDNFKIAASCSESKLSEMTQQMADSGNPPDSVVLSEMLTVWRKLWIERDSMDAVASSGAEKNYISGTASRYELISPAPKKTRVYLGKNLPSEMDDEDQYDMGVYKVPGKSPYLVHYSSSRSWPLEDYIDVVGDPNGDGAGKDYDLYDDDYHPITLQPHVTLPSYPDLGSYTDEFRRAYIEPNYLSDSDVVSFDRNMGLGDSGWNDQFDNTPSSGFWSALSVAAYQPITSHDGDPETTSWLGEAHMSRNDLALYLEAIENEAGESPNKAMAHEIGHTGGLEHCSDETCIMYEDASYNFCDDCLAEMRGKGSSW